MFKPFTALLLASFVLSSCGTVRDSRVNPFNWFGRSQPAQTQPSEAVNPLLPRQRSRLLKRPDEIYQGVAISTVSEMKIERTISGAIIHATGVANRQGGYDARLTPVNPDELPLDGVLSYTFDVVYPRRNSPAGAERTRQITVARSLTHEELQGVRVIRVQGVQNSLESRRR